MVICGDQRSAAGSDDAGLEVDDRLLQHRLIKLEADFLDVAGLLLAEQIARTADVEVVRGELEAGAQRLQRLQHGEPALGLRRDLLLRRQREQRIGPQLGATDAAAQLIELGKAEHVGAVHDQRVGVGDIEAGFHDGGRQQDVEFAVVERRHDVLDHGGRHLAVRDRDLHLRHVLVEEILDLGEIVDARHHVERLAAAITLAQQRLADHQGIVRGDEGADREAVDRRRSDDRELAHAGQRQLQRARDRRGRQRQHMHLGAQLLQPLLVGDAKMLLLVDDDEAEVAELDGLAEQRMGADNDVDRAVGDALLDLLSCLVGTRREACATFTGKPLKRSVKVL